MSQRELSRRSGVPQPHICEIEAGKGALVSTYERLVAAMGAELILKANPVKPREAVLEELAAERESAEERRCARRQALRFSRRERAAGL